MSFAKLSKEERARISSLGGKAAHAKGTAHQFTRDEARAAGKIGGKITSQNRERMRENGRKGALSLRRTRTKQTEFDFSGFAEGDT